MEKVIFLVTASQHGVGGGYFGGGRIPVACGQNH